MEVGGHAAIVGRGCNNCDRRVGCVDGVVELRES